MSTNAIANLQTKQLSSERVFGYIIKSDVSRICIKRTSYEGHTFIDFREEYNQDGEWKYSKKGFTLGAEDEVIKEFKTILENAIEVLEAGN